MRWVMALLWSCGNKWQRQRTNERHTPRRRNRNTLSSRPSTCRMAILRQCNGWWSGGLCSSTTKLSGGGEYWRENETTGSITSAVLCLFHFYNHDDRQREPSWLRLWCCGGAKLRWLLAEVGQSVAVVVDERRTVKRNTESYNEVKRDFRPTCSFPVSGFLFCSFHW